MRPDGTEMQALTNEPGIHHGLPTWSPDGRTLLYQRYDVTQPDGRPAIWSLDIASGSQREIAPEGFLPQWQKQNALSP